MKSTELNAIFDEFNHAYAVEREQLESNVYAMIGMMVEEFEELVDETVTHHGESFITNKPNFVKEAIDIIYVTLQQLRQRGVNLDAVLSEVHRSNMSKPLPGDLPASAIAEEMNVALERYPEATLVQNGEMVVIKDAKTNKVIKPMTYSKAVITPEMYGEK